MYLNNVSQFVYRYIVEPIKLDSGYNWVNTAMIASLFLVASWLLWKFIFSKGLAKIDRKFLVSIAGWLMFGATARVLEDAGIVKSFLFITPFIYAWIGLLGAVSLMLFLKIERKWKIEYWKTWGTIGFLLSAFNIFLLEIKNIHVILIVAAAIIVSYFAISFSGKIFPLYNEKMNRVALSGQLADGISSFIGITFFGFWEKHILGRSLIEFLQAHQILLVNGSAAWSIIAMKIIVISFVLYFIDKYSENRKEKEFIKMLIFALGLMLGIRNTLQIAALG